MKKIKVSLDKVIPIRGGTEMPVCPGFLDPLAKAEWERIVHRLHGMGKLTLFNEDLLAFYCYCFAFWKRFKRKREIVKYYRSAKVLARAFGFPMDQRGMNLTRPLRLTRRKR